MELRAIHHFLSRRASTREVKRARDIFRRISRRIDAWEAGQVTMLVEGTLRSMEAALALKQGTTTAEQRAKTFHQKVLRGNIQGAVRYLTDREKGGVLYPNDIDEKSGKSGKPSPFSSSNPQSGNWLVEMSESSWSSRLVFSPSFVPLLMAEVRKSKDITFRFMLVILFVVGH